jgi:hypothetical protein
MDERLVFQGSVAEVAFLVKAQSQQSLKRGLCTLIKFCVAEGVKLRAFAAGDRDNYLKTVATKLTASCNSYISNVIITDSKSLVLKDAVEVRTGRNGADCTPCKVLPRVFSLQDGGDYNKMQYLAMKADFAPFTAMIVNTVLAVADSTIVVAPDFEPIRFSPAHIPKENKGDTVWSLFQNDLVLPPTAISRQYKV